MVLPNSSRVLLAYLNIVWCLGFWWIPITIFYSKFGMFDGMECHMFACLRYFIVILFLVIQVPILSVQLVVFLRNPSPEHKSFSFV